MIYTIFILFLLSSHSSAFLPVTKLPSLQITHRLSQRFSNIDLDIINRDNRVDVKSKTISFMKLIRYKNILPAVVLSFYGGWITNPSIVDLLRTKTFIVGSLNTIFIMSSSMIMNDIFDLNIDRINNPSRPLVTREITIREAMIANTVLLATTEFLTFRYLPPNLQRIIQYAILHITIYTPVLKCIPFIKNLSCAALVSFSILFAGLTVADENKNIELLITASRLLFFGSLWNELLLDMADREGDKINNIYTIPVIFGNDKSWLLASMIMKCNLLWNMLDLTLLYSSFRVGFLSVIICAPLLASLNKIKQNKYNKLMIRDVVNKSTKPLFISLAYLCILRLTH